MKNILKIIKGSFVGMGSILPGISGSMIAAVLKIYQELIDALNDFLKTPIDAVKRVWQYIVGVLLGFVIGFVFINLVYEILPIPITFLFIGFILGAIPSLYKEVKSNHYKWHHYVTFGISALLMVSFIFIKESETNVDSIFYYISIFLVGIIYAVALIIPGLSGSTMLMAFGYFQLLLTTIDDIMTSLVNLDFSAVLSQLPLVLLLVLGAITGLILVGKLMHYLLHHYKKHFYIAVLGIVFVSPFNVLFTLQSNTNDNVFNASFWVYLLGLCLFVLGLFVTYHLSKKGENKND